MDQEAWKCQMSEESSVDFLDKNWIPVELHKHQKLLEEAGDNYLANMMLSLYLLFFFGDFDSKCFLLFADYFHSFHLNHLIQLVFEKFE